MLFDSSEELTSSEESRKETTLKVNERGNLETRSQSIYFKVFNYTLKNAVAVINITEKANDHLLFSWYICHGCDISVSVNRAQINLQWSSAPHQFRTT